MRLVRLSALQSLTSDAMEYYLLLDFQGFIQTMRTIKRILVPVDYSPVSQQVIRWGVALARRVKARIYFLHVDETNQPSKAEDNIFGGLRRAFAVDERLKRFVKEHGGIDSPFLLNGIGVPATVIVTAVDLLDIDLLVMGTHGLNPSDMLLGTSSAAAIANTDCWILLLRANQNAKEPDFFTSSRQLRVLVASSLAPDSLPLLRNLHRFVYALDGDLTILHIENEDRDGERAHTLRNYLHDELGPFAQWSKTVITEGDPATRIFEVADEIRADFVVTGAGAVKGWERFIPGSVSRKVLYDSRLPVLILKHQVSVEELFERYQRIAKNLDSTTLQGEQKETIEWDGLFNPLSRKQNLFLGFYSKAGLETAFTEYGFFRQLAYQGYNNITVAIDVDHPTGHRMRIQAPHPYQSGEMVDLVDLVARKVSIETNAFRPAFNPERHYDGMSIEWICLQDPHQEAPDQGDRLPGQRYSGLGVGREMLVLLMLAAKRLGLDALLANPMHFSNAFLYHPYFRFIDAEFEGEMAALIRDTSLLSLTETSRLLDAKAIVDTQGNVFEWVAHQQIFPLNPELAKNFSSVEYRQMVTAAKRRYRFVVTAL